jgi:hypothetical protein
MLIPFVVALQLHAAGPAWKVLDRAAIAWRAGATPYEVVLEEPAEPTGDADLVYRIRVRVPGKRDFIVVDDRGLEAYVPVREALRGGNRALIPRGLADSARMLLLPLHGDGGTSVFAVFGAGEGSDPNELTLIGFDATGYPRLLLRKVFDLVDVTDLDGDGAPEIVGLPSLSQTYGKCSSTYDPYAVYRFSAGKPQYDLALSRRYNEAHYVWAGAEASEKIEVSRCTPGKYRAVPRQP